MPGRLLEDVSLRDRRSIFSDRVEAGRMLAGLLVSQVGGDEMVLSIPAGGVPVGIEISRAYSLPMDLLVVRKLQLPGNPEAGFGALDPEGRAVLNDSLVRRYELRRSVIDAEIRRTLDVIRHRDRLFRSDRPFPELEGRGVIVTDDGLASGYTMRSAVGFLMRRSVGRITVAVPTGFKDTVETMLDEVDCVACLNVRGGASFAVAEAYVNWRDIGDEEVVSLLEEYPD